MLEDLIGELRSSAQIPLDDGMWRWLSQVCYAFNY